MSTLARGLQLLSLLQSRPIWTGEQLTTALDTDDRTLRRDIKRLRDLGFQIHASRGTGGGYSLRAGGGVPAHALTQDETTATMTALRIFTDQGMHGLHEPASQALHKLAQHLPQASRATPSAEDISVHTIHRFPGASSTYRELLPAIREHHRVRFGYTTRDGAHRTRHTEPHRIVVMDLRWYLQAFDLDRQDWRMFRLDRVETLHVTTFHFRPRTPPPPMSMDGQPTHTVRIHAQLSQVMQALPVNAGSFTDEGDTCVLRTPGDAEWIARKCASLPWAVTPLSSPQLHDALATVAAQIVQGLHSD